MTTHISLLESLTEEERARLLIGAKPRAFMAEEHLLREGWEGSSMFFVDEGEVEVRRNGNLIATLGSGSTVGEMSLLDPAPRSATVTALGYVNTRELDRATVWGMLADGDPAAIKLLQGITAVVCARLDGVNRLVQDEVVQPRGTPFSRLIGAVFGRS